MLPVFYFIYILLLYTINCRYHSIINCTSKLQVKYYDNDIYIGY